MSDAPHITQNFGRPSYRPPATAGMDPEMRRMAMMAAGFGGILAIFVGVFSFSGHSRHHGVPVIAAPATPVRVKPANPGGMQLTNVDDPSSPQSEKLAPAAEKPAIRALRAKKIAKAEVQPVIAAVKPPVTETVTPAPPPPAAAQVTGGVSVQLAAFDSEQAAQQDWGKMAEKMPKMFDGHRPEVLQAHITGRVVYRLRTSGFTSLAAATTFCNEIHAKGGDCSIAAF